MSIARLGEQLLLVGSRPLTSNKTGEGAAVLSQSRQSEDKACCLLCGRFWWNFTMHVLFYQKEFLLINVTFPTQWIISHTGYHYIFGIKTRTVVEKV